MRQSSGLNQFHECVRWEIVPDVARDAASVPPRARLGGRKLLLGTVGEPISPKAWLWYYSVIGGERCPVVDTWWQTETGAIMISSLPSVLRTLYQDPDRYVQTYFTRFGPRVYFVGDGARRDEDGYFWIDASTLRDASVLAKLQQATAEGQ